MGLFSQLGDMLLGRTGAKDLNTLTDDERRTLRPMADLFRILARQPVSLPALRHCESVYEGLPSPDTDSRMISAVRGSLLLAIADGHRALGNGGDRTRWMNVARSEAGWTGDSRLSPGFHFPLSSALTLTTHMMADQRDIAPVVWGMLHEWKRVGVRSAQPVLIALRSAQFTPGNGFVMSLVEFAEACYPGVVAEAIDISLARAVRSRSGDRRTDAAETAVFAAGALVRLNPADHHAAELRRRAQELLLGAPVPLPSATAGVADLPQLDPGEWDGYLQALRESPLAEDVRAAKLVQAAYLRIPFGKGHDERAVRAFVTTAHQSHAVRARRILDLDGTLARLLIHLLDGTHGTTAIRVAELGAECRDGAAVRATPISVADSAVGTAYCDIPFGPTDDVDVTALAEAFPGTVFVWIDEHPATDENAGTDQEQSVFLGAGLDTTTGRTWTAKLKARLDTGRDGAAARDIELVTARDVRTGLAKVAGLLPIGDTVATRVVVIPNHRASRLPWSQLLPESITEYYTCPSVGALMRRRGERPACPLLGARPRILGIFDDALPGVRLELAALTGLREAGLIEFERVRTFDKLRAELAAGGYDLLTIGVHGSPADGAEYRMMLPDGEATPAMVFGLALPPIVVLGSCWSAQTTSAPDFVATSVGCLAAGADLVVGGLWAIDDLAAGRVLADAYARFAAGVPFAAAVRSGRRAGEPAAEGLTVHGFPARTV
ncbi:CHAT domain-containing protein [Catellatospora sp. IY07-71]|uniref:CHAT domain-containing protein n=1 Tax=Catellatospora sp. IY07-71 TaxID=2728827 RepID=UPI001BB45C51|nr:CHAT domain-containing protein [Catellatospora sp. IY07-71]